MSKRTIILGFGTVVGMGIAARVSEKMRAHCSGMAAQCKQMAKHSHHRETVTTT